MELQHISLRKDDSLQARNVTSTRCHPHGRRAVPARSCISAHPNTTLPCPCNRIPPSPSSPHPTLNTATQAAATPALNPHPNNSLVALQNVSLCKDESLYARNVTSTRCHPYGRLTIPARARISAHANTTLPFPCTLIPNLPQDHTSHSTPLHNHPHTQPSILIQKLTCRIAKHQPSQG